MRDINMQFSFCNMPGNFLSQNKHTSRLICIFFETNTSVAISPSLRYYGDYPSQKIFIHINTHYQKTNLFLCTFCFRRRMRNFIIYLNDIWNSYFGVYIVSFLWLEVASNKGLRLNWLGIFLIWLRISSD